MKLKLVLALLTLGTAAVAQIDDLKKADDLGARLFGSTAPLELDFQKSYRFEEAYNYELHLDGPALEKKKRKTYQIYENENDSTTLLIDRSQDSKSLHDASLSGMLSMREQGMSPCVQMHRLLVASTPAPVVYSETGKVEIIAGWKCAEYVFEDNYHIYTLWMNLDENHQLLTKQMGSLLSINALISQSIPEGLLVSFSKRRKSSSVVELELTLKKKSKINYELDTSPCFEVSEEEREE